MAMLKNDNDEQSGLACLSPTPIATMETDATIASKISTTSPMRSAPMLGNFSAPQALGGQYQRSSIYIKQQQQHHSQNLPSKSQSLPQQEKTEIAKAQRTNNKKDKKHIIRRSGKWTAVEELYVNILIELFEEGRIDEYEKRMESGDHDSSSTDGFKRPRVKVENGMTMRAYLSQKLFCSPMRISKKFAGRGIGKLVYMSQRPGSFYAARQRFGFPVSNHQIPSGLLTANDWNKLNRLKEAESDFLKLAFPQSYSTSHSTSSARNRDTISPSQKNPQKMPIMPSPSSGITRPIVPSDIGGYRSSLKNNELIHYQHNHEADGSWTTNNQQVQHQRKRQRVDREKQSSVQALEEAYITSISPNKAQASTSDASNSVRANNNNAQHLTAEGTASNNDWNRPMSDSTESGINVPNFLVGFDKASKSQPTNNFDQQIIENSPAYHTSSSFDDFHRFLGKGLSPPSSSLKFPNLRSIPTGTAIPSTRLSSPASVSKLQRRPRSSQNEAPFEIGNIEETSIDLTPIRKNTSKAMPLSGAHAKATKSSEDQDTVNNELDLFDPYAVKPTTAQSQLSEYATEETNKEFQCPPNQIQQQESSDFPIDGMMFEDFDTLATYTEVGNPVSGAGAFISDGSDCTQSEGSYPDRVRYSFGQPENAFGKNQL